ncbi:MAG TPA: MmgE/PrpD family protein [Stellaceae bacterium]|nr:MmgE/PrpD family protein [Stellaceae bacterium]
MDGASVTGTPDLTQALASRASATTYDALPAGARLLARQCLLDYYACGIAGADDPLVAILVAEMQEMGGVEIAHLIGHKGRMPALSAALVNGAASHALDYDDVNLAMPGHPSVAVLPGLIALAEERKSSGRDLIAAFIGGYETACRAGLSVRPGHYGRGFHATGTVGVFGAAAACAHLLGLDAEGVGRALGIAGTQAAGLKSQFGTMCKPFHAGKAAQNGLLAARLAARGFSSRPDLIECDQGFAKTHSNVWNPEAALAEPSGGFHVYANLFKYHAACYMTHAPIECARQIRDRHHAAEGDIAAIKLSVNRGSSRICNIQAPGDGLQAKFSLRQTVAMALAGIDTASLGAYSVATATDPALVRLRERIELDFQDDLAEAGAELAVTLRDGTVAHATHDAGLAMTDFAAQGARLADKFDALVEPVLGAARTRELRAMIEGLDDVAEIGALARLAAA